MPKVTITMDGWQCSRCEWQWVPRYYYAADKSMVPPKVCPHCKSPYWDIEPRKARRRPPSAPAGDAGQGGES